ncbi:ribonuclease HII [Helicobacter monodelphidis]|uniref:ribonuclease HII n=1 Tax=Helicobacter sp. 15-1451 TaxID=2004995 RepID=UPI000DCD5AB5|nr:ribonuclease HII [Helicobacter sp. 15-1451]RAX57101.1 ribonuclease HII [Helicobacter sp. 15-1451]
MVKHKICGVDEAGRGCIAGSLFMAGVILKSPIDGLNDSKKLSRTQRFLLEKHIHQSSEYIIVSFDATQIDTQGLSACLHTGLLKIQKQLNADEYIFDGNCNFGIKSYKTLIKGDQQLQEIQAASILAKCAKDRESLDLDQLYPKYLFKNHCGYATKKHLQAIMQYGKLPCHRKSFQIQAPRLF